VSLVKQQRKKEIKHYFNYPRYPNGHWTLQMSFLMYREDYELEDILQILIKMFVVHVMYNIERFHHSLNKNYLYSTFVIS
jgi:hypothetical protein